MSTYSPDCWVVVKCPEDGHMRVLAGWSGGYTQGDSWQLNSGIVRCEYDDDRFTFYGNSGSKYICHKDSYTVRMSTAGMMKKLQNAGWDLMDEDTDWNSVEWIE